MGHRQYLRRPNISAPLVLDWPRCHVLLPLQLGRVLGLLSLACGDSSGLLDFDLGLCHLLPSGSWPFGCPGCLSSVWSYQKSLGLLDLRHPTFFHPFLRLFLCFFVPFHRHRLDEEYYGIYQSDATVCDSGEPVGSIA